MSKVLAALPIDLEQTDLHWATAAACVAWWALTSVSSEALGVVLFLLGLAIPLLGWKLLPLMLLGSFFFHSTMALPADWLYLLRVYWLGVYLACLLANANLRVPKAIWFWFLGGAIVLSWGVLIGALRVGSVDGISRSPLVDGLASVVWLSCVLVGSRFYLDLNRDAMRRALLVVSVIWLLSVSYGLRQLLFGLGPDTVPPDIYAQVRGAGQYEFLGRRPFAFLSANGITVVSLLPICILLSQYRHRLTIVVGTLLLGVGIWAMTLTRSFAMLLGVIVVGLWPTFRVALPLWLISLLLLGTAGAVVAVEIGLETLLELARFAEFGDTTRSLIWGYTWNHLDASDLALGIGYGTASWEAFFTELYGSKILQSPHSASLEFVGQFGVLGLIFYAVLVMSVFKWVLADAREQQATLLSPALALIMLREQVAATYIFSPNFLSGFFWILFGMAVAQHVRSVEE